MKTHGKFFIIVFVLFFLVGSFADDLRKRQGGGNGGGGNGGGGAGGGGNGGGGNGGGAPAPAPPATTASPTASATPSPTSNETIIDPRIPPGSIQMTTPPSKTLIKFGSTATFGWKYLQTPQIPPKNLTIEVQASVNKKWYPIANLSGAETTYVWDTSKMTESLISEYTLWIYDERGRTAAPQPGRLQAFNGFIFGMYTPQPYTPLGDYECAVCNAGSTIPVIPIAVSVGITIVTMLKFTLFTP